jgi:hypothetical protein
VPLEKLDVTPEVPARFIVGADSKRKEVSPVWPVGA